MNLFNELHIFLHQELFVCILFLLMFFGLLPYTFTEQFTFIQQLFDTCYQIVFAERFDDIGIRSHAYRFGLRFIITFRRQDNHRNMTDLEIFTDALQHLYSIHIRHHLVGDYHVGMIEMYFLQPLHTIIGHINIEFIFQLQFQHIA